MAAAAPYLGYGTRRAGQSPSRRASSAAGASTSAPHRSSPRCLLLAAALSLPRRTAPAPCGASWDAWHSASCPRSSRSCTCSRCPSPSPPASYTVKPEVGARRGLGPRLILGPPYPMAVDPCLPDPDRGPRDRPGRGDRRDVETRSHPPRATRSPPDSSCRAWPIRWSGSRSARSPVPTPYWLYNGAYPLLLAVLPLLLALVLDAPGGSGRPRR